MKQIYLFLITLIGFNFGYGQDPIVVAVDKGNVALGQSSSVGFADNLSAIGFTRGSGLGNDASLGATFTASNWNALGNKETAKNANDYIEWSITADPNFKLKISALRIAANTTLGGPRKWQIFYSMDNFISEAPLSSVTDLMPFDGDEYPLSPINVINLNITTDFGGTINFRLYAWGGSGTENNMLAIQQTILGTNFGITNPGCRIRGIMSYDGMLYSNEQWTPAKPSDLTGNENVYVANGTYEIGKDINGTPEDQNIFVKNLVIANGATITIPPTSNLTVNENLSVGDNIDNPGKLVLNSTSTRYSSLIVTGTATGNVTYNRHVNINTAGNDLISAPVTGQSFDQFILNNDNIRNNNGTLFLFGPFDKAVGDYLNWTNTETTALLPAVGYRAASNDNGTFAFSGEVNTSVVDANVAFAGPSFERWNLIGNPYPSYIDLEKFLLANMESIDTDVLGVYGYDGDASDGWEIINLAKLTLPGNENRLIAPGQGFYVGSKPEGGTVSFTPAMRSIGSSDDFIQGRTAVTDAAFAELKISNGKKNHKTELYFNDRSTKALDKGYDAAVFGKKAPSFAIYSQLLENNTGLDLAIQSLPFGEVSSDVAIPIGINVSAGQQIKVSLGKMILPEGTEVYLEDKVNNSITLLNNADYTFRTEATIKDTGRFFLRFANRSLSSSNPIESDGLQIFATASKRIVINGLLKNDTRAVVYDIQGREVSNTILKANTNSNTLDLSNVNMGIYIVKLKNNSQEITQKIVLK